MGNGPVGPSLLKPVFQTLQLQHSHPMAQIQVLQDSGLYILIPQFDHHARRKHYTHMGVSTGRSLWFNPYVTPISMDAL